MRRVLPLVCQLLTIPVAAGAQTTTADGVQALLRGDYGTATRILKPLADAPDPDPTAQFFTALAYDSGLGLPRFDFRSCRYYLDAVKPANPFMTASAALGDSIRQRMPPAAVEFCSGPVPFPDPPPNPAGAPVAAVGPEVARAVDALVRGDYGRAYEILKPIAEPRETTNHAAQFILGTMYDDGRGAPRDPTRACALYQRAMSGPSNELFNQQAMALARHFFMSRGKEAYAECDLLANVGFEHGFDAVTFTLAPGHSITLDVQGATILYEGREKRLDRGWLGFAMPGAKFLPARHTALDTARPTPERRHFIEMFMWRPARDGTWTLDWHVFEVVRDDLKGVGGGELAHVTAPQPPLDRTDLRDRGVLRVNGSGDAELEVRGGASARTQVIPSDAERREVEKENRAKAAAEASIDWNLRRDPARAPALSYGDAGGCGNLTAYGQSTDRSEAILVQANKDALGLSPAPQAFNLAAPRSDLKVVVHVFDHAVRNMPFCSDLIDGSLKSEEWRAVAGTITIDAAPPGTRASYPSWMYQATITITGAEFVNSRGERARQAAPIRLQAFVGGMLGG
jgi:hypothetical protein